MMYESRIYEKCLSNQISKYVIIFHRIIKRSTQQTILIITPNIHYFPLSKKRRKNLVV